MLAARGRFEGKLSQIRVSGNTDVPDFAVITSGHVSQLRTTYSAFVNALNGDVRLASVRASILDTRLLATGTISGRASKTALLDFVSEGARIDDLLRIFVKSNTPAMRGPIVLRSQVRLPPGKEPFLRRLQLNGDFSIADARFSRERTQSKVNELSQRAQGE